MTTKYFQDFGIVNYRFGDNEDPVLFNNLTQYVDLLDQIRDNTTFYNKYTIKSGDRPDTLSYLLYGTTDYYWTFYLMNENLRRDGWPIFSNRISEIAKLKYPHRTLTTTADIGDRFTPGQEFFGLSSGTVGKILKRNLDLGQIVYDSGGNNLNSGETVQLTQASLTGTDITNPNIAVRSDSTQVDSVHHYEDANGVTQDIDPHTYVIPSGYKAVSFRDRLEEVNDDLRQIIVLKPDVIGRVAAEFSAFMRNEQS